MSKTILSEQFSLNLRDFLRGAILAVIAAVVPIINNAIVAATNDNVPFVVNWTTVGLAALSAFVAYIVKSYLEPTKVIELKPSDATVEALKSK